MIRKNPPKIKVKCPCGAEFSAYDLGSFTRCLCDACVEKARTEEDARERRKAAALAEQLQAERVKRAHIPFDWQKKTFANSDPKIHPVASKSCQSYAMQFKVRESPSLIIYSSVIGSGKTHLAACIANYLLHERHIDVRFEKARDVLLQLKRTFERSSRESEEDVITRIVSFDVLILDDIGWDSPTDWTFSTYWDIFDRRMDAHLPVIVTTNCAPEEGGLLEKRIGHGAISRLRGMCGDNIIHFGGKDLR